MPWTRQQVRYLLSSGSPLKGTQKEKMKNELHANPEMGHKEKSLSRTEAAAQNAHSYNESRRASKRSRS